jgi:hypothetical protein
MLIVQKFHSIHEIDQEFIPSLEILLQEDAPNFDTLKEKQDSAPADVVFTYFLFFGPTQNTPIGFAQLALRTIPGKDLIPWWKRFFFFWRKDYLNWKQLTWKVGDGHSGLFVFDPRYARSGREKIQELIKEYESRLEIKSQEIFHIKGLQDSKSSWSPTSMLEKERFVLEPMVKSVKTYQEYLGSLNPETQDFIKRSWRDMHVKNQVELGDYPNPKETPTTFPVDEKLIQRWEKMGAQILTFEKDLKVLGCLVVLKGKNGNIFFEPFPFEPHQQEQIVPDELYTQYALIKFFEMPEARKCHLLKFGSKLIFEEKEDLKFFQEQHFQFKTLSYQFTSQLPQLTHPL